MTDAFVIAESAIRQLNARFVDAVFRQDCETFAGCFAEDGEWKIAGMHMAGREAIAEACRTLLGRCDRIQLITQTPLLEVDGDTAQGRQPMIEIATMPDGTAFLTIGVYHERYVRVDGRWFYRHRHWAMKYRGPFEMSGAWADTPDYGAFPAGPAADEPTYVRKA